MKSENNYPYFAEEKKSRKIETKTKKKQNVLLAHSPTSTIN